MRGRRAMKAYNRAKTQTEARAEYNARILREIATEGSINDINGNRIGQYDLKEE